MPIIGFFDLIYIGILAIMFVGGKWGLRTGRKEIAELKASKVEGTVLMTESEALRSFGFVFMVTSVILFILYVLHLL